FWWALLLILFFWVWTGGLLPSDFNYDTSLVPGFSPGFVGSVLQHAVLPAATLLITSIGGWILTMRNNMITTLAEDYVRMGRAKGLPNRRIMYNYAARNAFLPNLSGFAMSLGFVIAGAILVEYVFNYPGLGYLLYNSVQNTDYPLMQVLFMLFTVAVLVAVFTCDVVIAWMDPRARAKECAGDHRHCPPGRAGADDRAVARQRRRHSHVDGRAPQPQGGRGPGHLRDILRARGLPRAVHLGARPDGLLPVR